MKSLWAHVNDHDVLEETGLDDKDRCLAFLEKKRKGKGFCGKLGHRKRKSDWRTARDTARETASTVGQKKFGDAREAEDWVLQYGIAS